MSADRVVKLGETDPKVVTDAQYYVRSDGHKERIVRRDYACHCGTPTRIWTDTGVFATFTSAHLKHIRKGVKW